MKKPTRFLRKIVFVFIYTLFISTSSQAQLSVSRLFSDGAIVQRDQEFTIWGWGDAGTTISVTFSDSAKTTTVESDGTWSVTIGAIIAGGPHTLTVTDGTTSITRSDLMMGDVYLVSGQSNMEMTLNNAYGGAAEAINANYPNIRQLFDRPEWCF